MLLTLDKAHEISKKEDHYSYDGYTSIDDDAAQFLAKKHGSLIFPDLREMPLSTARHFSKHRGFLTLPCLSAISAEALQYLPAGTMSLTLGQS